MTEDPILTAIRGRKSTIIPHWEHWSCPDAETYLTGIDYYNHPRLCRLKLRQLYPQLGLPVPAQDDPISRPELDADGAKVDDLGRHRVRWGDNYTWEWDWGQTFTTEQQVLDFHPLETDFTNIPVVESRDYRDETTLFADFRRHWPAHWGQSPPPGRYTCASFYNTLFMWPLLTFGWDLFMRCCLLPEFQRVLDDFAQISRRVFTLFTRLPVNVVICHDDIVGTRGPICSPAWMRKHIFPRYEEYWDILHRAGKKVIFMSDGNMTAFADDVFACGADGIVTEPHTDFRDIARRHPGKFLAGEGDNRILSRNDPDEIRAMVQRMVETSRMCGGYAMCIGNHIPWNVTPQGIKCYLEQAVQAGAGPGMCVA